MIPRRIGAFCTHEINRLRHKSDLSPFIRKLSNPALTFPDMNESIQFTYNKRFAYFWGAGLLIFIVAMIVRSHQLDNPKQIQILRYFEYLFILFLAYFIYKYLMPAIQNKTALELNETYIIDYVRSRTINWSEVIGIKLISFRRGGYGIALQLIDKKSFVSGLRLGQRILSWMTNLSYGTPVVIPLQYISGANKIIFESLNSFIVSNQKYNKG